MTTRNSAVGPADYRVTPPNSTVRLGAGLTRLGRPWGVIPSPVPTDDEAHAFLETAIALGVDFFDTAPSYGTSEARLGQFLSTLVAPVRARVFIATKFGEHWDAASGTSRVDHGYDALARSLEQSLRRLGHVDLIQLHRTSPDALRSSSVSRAFALARTLGVSAIGASVSRVDDARRAIQEHGVEWLQLPYHLGNSYMEETFALAAECRARILVNRPFGMGAILGDGGNRSPEFAFRFILAQRFSGAILTGTASAAHLRENMAAFARASEATDALPPAG